MRLDKVTWKVQAWSDVCLVSYSHYCGRLSLVCLSVYCLKVAFTSLLFLPSFHSMCFFPVIYFLKSSESKLVFSLCLFSLALNNNKETPNLWVALEVATPWQEIKLWTHLVHATLQHTMRTFSVEYDTVTVDSTAVQIRQLMDTFGSFHKKRKSTTSEKTWSLKINRFFFVH